MGSSAERSIGTKTCGRLLPLGALSGVAAKIKKTWTDPIDPTLSIPVVALAGEAVKRRKASYSKLVDPEGLYHDFKVKKLSPPAIMRKRIRA